MTPRRHQQFNFNEHLKSSSSAFHWRWLIYGGVGVVLLAILGNYSINEWGLLEGLSWGVVIFFLLYTFILFLYFGKQSGASSVVSWSQPNGLSRFRSYLTFLPITHIIQQGEGTNRETAECRKSETDDNELSLRIGIQKDLVIEAILAEYVAPWYTKISSNTAFLQKCRIILQSIFQQVGEKLRQVDRNEIAKEVIQTVHMHWKEYCDAASKSNLNDEENIIKRFKFVHPYLQDEMEVSQRYEKMICHLLEDLVIPDLQSTLLCQFLAGILVKSFFLYYTDLLCQPCWINSNLIVLLSSDTILAELAGSSSQNSSAPATPLPDHSPKITADDENDCFTRTPPPTSITPISDEHDATGSSTPPQKLDEGSGEGMRFIFGKIDHGLSASTTRDYYSPLDRIKVQNDSPISSRTSRGSPSPTTSVSSALSGILPTTAFPLLPSSCSYNPFINPNPNNSSHPCLSFFNKEDASVLSVDTVSTGNGGVEKVQTTFSISTTDGDDCEPLECASSTSLVSSENLQSYSEHHEGNQEPSASDISVNNNCVKEDGNLTFKATAPTHYFSFEEVSTRKSSHSLLDATTLSVDGALDNRKKATETKGSNTHELKIVGNEFDAKNTGRSPVYEEPEDFATSIAKLRSLLEQKESKKNLHAFISSGIDTNFIPSDNESSSLIDGRKSSYVEQQNVVPEEEGGETCHESTKFQREDHPTKPSHDSQFTSNPAPLQDENEDVPELKCYFHNITIPKAESYNDSGGQFDFYCIQYEGVYFDEKYDDHPRVILRTTTVKRRFKEFLLLQSKLEEQSQWKPHLKGIKAPNRWLNLSFSKADAATTRKTNLERYLNQICSHPVLGTSREVLQFMAYGDEGFSLDPLLDSNDPKHLLSNKLEKLAKKFTGVINSLKDALPSFESNLPSPHFEGDEHPTQNIHSSASFQFKDDRSPEAVSPHENLMQNSLDATWLENLVPSLEGSDDMMDNRDECSPPFSNVTVKISDVSPDACTDIGDDDSESSTEYPLAASLTQLLCDVLWLPTYRPHNASVSTFMSLSGKSLENYVQETIDVFLSDEAVLGYLEWFGKSLKTETESVHDLQHFDLSTELDLKNCLRKRIPAWVRWMWGRNRLDLTIERITGFFQNPIINQDLVLSLSELLFSKITPLQ